MQLPLGIFGVAIACYAPVHLAQQRRRQYGGIPPHAFPLAGNGLPVDHPSSIGLAVLGKSIIGAIYQIGKLNLYDTQQTSMALTCYAVGLAGYAALKVLSPCFYALGDARYAR